MIRDCQDSQYVLVMDLIAMLQELRKMNQRFNDRMDQSSDGFMQDLPRNRQSEVLPVQQARPEGEDTYSEESGELKDDFVADEGERITRSKVNLGKSQIWFKFDA